MRAHALPATVNTVKRNGNFMSMEIEVLMVEMDKFNTEPQKRPFLSFIYEKINYNAKIKKEI